MRAWESPDVEAPTAMLAEDVTMAMPPYPFWWQGRDALMAAVTNPDSPFYERWRYLPTRANGQLAFPRLSLGSRQAELRRARARSNKVEGMQVREISWIRTAGDLQNIWIARRTCALIPPEVVVVTR